MADGSRDPQPQIDKLVHFLRTRSQIEYFSSQKQLLESEWQY